MALKNYIFIWLFVTVNYSFSQSMSYSDRAGKIGISPRAIALGNANSSSYQQSLDFWQNASLLTNQVSKYSFAYAHNDAFKGISKLDAFVFTVNPDSSSTNFGFGFFQLSNGNIFDTRNLEQLDGSYDFNQLNLLSSKDYGLRWFMARKITSKTSIGGVLDLDLLSVSDFSHARSIGLDLSATTMIDSLSSLSIVVYNPLGKYFFWNQNTSLLQQTYFKSNNYIKSNSFYIELPGFQLSVDRTLYNNNIVKSKLMYNLSCGFGSNSNTMLQNSKIGLDMGLGLETSIKQILIVRIGANDFQHNDLEQSKFLPQYAMGVGLNLEKVSVDYSLGNFTKTTIPAQKHLLALTYNFEKFSKDIPITEPSRL